MYRVTTNNYFKAKKQGGYDSKFEAGYAQELTLRKKAKDIKDFKAHVTIPLEVNGYHICNYIVDFVVEHNDQTLEYVETKGYVMPTWVIKWKLFEALYADKPGVTLTVVMQGKNRIPHAKRVKMGRHKIFT